MSHKLLAVFFMTSLSRNTTRIQDSRPSFNLRFIKITSGKMALKFLTDSRLFSASDSSCEKGRTKTDLHTDELNTIKHYIKYQQRHREGGSRPRKSSLLVHDSSDTDVKQGRDSTKSVRFADRCGLPLANVCLFHDSEEIYSGSNRPNCSTQRNLSCESKKTVDILSLFEPIMTRCFSTN